MAQLLNYRNALLQAAAQRVIGSAVVVTSGAATSLNVPKGSNTTVPGTITLTASVTKFVSPAYAWYYKKYEDATFTLIAGQTLPTLDVVGNLTFLTANLDTSAVQYKVIVTETGTVYPSTAEYTVTIPILRDGTDSTLGFLTNEAVSVPANEVGVVPANVYSSLDSTLVIYRGTVDDSANWSATISAHTPGITAALVNGKTISITNITPEFNSGYVEIVATRQNYASIVKRLSIVKVATGISPTIYSIEPNVYAIAKNPDGTYNPSAVTFSSYSITGSTKTAYLGRINIYHNDSATPAYVSQDPEAVKTYTIPIEISTLRVELLSNDPPYAVLDSQTIPVAEAGSSSVNIIVTNSTFVIPANANNDILSYINSGTNITVREGINPLVYRNNLTGQVSSFTIGAATLSTGSGITVGSVSAGSDGSTVATILQHSNMLQALDSIIITYPVTYVRANGSQTTEYVTQSITKTATGYRGSRNVYGSDPTYTATYDYDGVGVTAQGAESYAKKADDLIYAATLNSSPRTPIEGDTVTFSNNSNYVYTITYKANTSSWTPPGTVIDGSLLVTGSVKADKLDTRELTVRDAAGNIVMQAGMPIDWTKLGTPSANLTGLGYTGALDATRNVFRGAWSTSTAYVAGDSITYNGSTWAAILAHTSVNGTNNPPTLPTISNTWWTLVAAKGDNGVNGTRTAILEMYRWAASAPTTFPSGSSTYTWATGQFTAPATVNGWSLTPPAPVAGQTLWMCRTIFADSLTSATSAITWSATAAVAAGGSGASGVNGTRTAVLELYRWSASTPTTFPSGSSIYTWATGAFTPPATLNSWGLTPGAAVAGQTLWGCYVTYADTGTSATSAVTWSASTAYAVGAAGSNGVDGSAGANAISAILSNEAHVFPAATDGAVSTYANSGTEVRVYEGATELVYDGVGTSNGTWKVTLVGTNITAGTLTDSGTFLTVGAHSGVSTGTDTSVIVYTITGKTSAGASFTITKNQTFTKSKAGATGAAGAAGAAGAQGPSVLVTPDRVTTFTATDGTLDASQADIVFTASVSGVASPTYVWSFSGFQTAPTNSGTATQTITAAQFGTAKSAIVTCTVNGTYTDKVTIVRLEKSTADAGATVGAPTGTYVGGVLAETVASNAALAGGALQKAGDAIIGPVTFATNGGILAATDADNGVFMGPNGLVGKKAGATTFAVDTAGNASFGGALNAATGTFAGSLNAATGSFAGSLSAATGTFSGALAASAINAVNTINIAGNAVTIPVGASGVSSTITTPGISTILSTGITLDEPGGVFMSMQVRIGFSVGPNKTCTAKVALVRDSVEIDSQQFTSTQTTGYIELVMYSGVDYPGSGYHSYTINITKSGDAGGTGIKHTQPQMFLLCVKR